MNCIASASLIQLGSMHGSHLSSMLSVSIIHISCVVVASACSCQYYKMRFLQPHMQHHKMYGANSHIEKGLYSLLWAK